MGTQSSCGVLSAKMVHFIITGRIDNLTKIEVPPKDKLESVYKSNKSIKKTAQELGVSHETVRTWLLSYGIERNPQGPNFRTNRKPYFLWEG